MVEADGTLSLARQREGAGRVGGRGFTHAAGVLSLMERRGGVVGRVGGVGLIDLGTLAVRRWLQVIGWGREVRGQ